MSLFLKQSDSKLVSKHQRHLTNDFQSFETASLFVVSWCVDVCDGLMAFQFILNQ